MSAESKIVFQRPHALLPVVTNYCPGCPHGIVHRLVAECIDELGVEGDTVGVAPVGCAALMYGYIDTDFIEVSRGMSRINVKVKSAEETEINGIGPDIAPSDIEALYTKLDALASDDILVISGSVPAALPGDIYERIMERLEGRGIRIVVDATRELLMNVLAFHPFLVKPNNHELGEIFGVELKARKDVVPYAKKLQALGARNVLVSMAGEGAVLVAENGDVIESPSPKGTVVNSVGAGDSMVAGFIAGYLESDGNYEQAFRMGVCAGSASAFSLGLAERDQVEELLATIGS